MQSPHPPHPPFPSRPGSPPGESDRILAARLGGPPAGRHDAVALLLARHWRATFDYAAVCLAAAGSSARLVASAAFQQVLGRPASGAAGGALRPRLLAAVRDTVRAWAADEAACVVLPELRKPAGGRGLRATPPGTPERGRVAERAFHALPGASQCLLWHTEVEAESINIPAGLLGMDTATAAIALRRARVEFRAGCLRAHRELAPSAECRFYSRLLDDPIPVGGAPPTDLRRHLTRCSHCRHAAEQLSRFEGGAGVLIAESVLGWGARRYLDSRPGRAAHEGSRGHAGHPAATRRPGAAPQCGRSRTTLAVGVGLASLGLLATALVAVGGPTTTLSRTPRPPWAPPSAARTAPPPPAPGHPPSPRTRPRPPLRPEGGSGPPAAVCPTVPPGRTPRRAEPPKPGPAPGGRNRPEPSCSRGAAALKAPWPG
ncbi:hydrolase [Streptomyces sp. NPDC059168]|uniref:hydrolase n=1 Tax=Streptomyces sp. NPDC059168 TaxID=3346753 RepID=UPI0036949059